MSIVHPSDPRGPLVYQCAQSGCPVCLHYLLDLHEGLIHAVVRRQWCGTARYADLLQEGRLALWQAVRHFNPHRGVAFSTYAWVAIQRRIWRVVAQQSPGSVEPAPPDLPDPAAAAETAWHPAAVRAALDEALRHLPERLRQVVGAAFGLDGQPPRSLAALGRDYGVSRERVRQWRNDAWVLLRRPALSGPLRRLCDQDQRAAYRQAEALNRAWWGRRGGRP